MNSIFKILNNRYAYHIYFWLLLYVVFVIWGSEINKSVNYGFRMSFAFVFPWMLAAYTHFYLLTRFFSKRKYLIYFSLLIPIIAAFGFLSELAVDKILFENQFERSGYTDVAIVLVVTTGLRYFRRGINQQYRMQEMEAKQLKSELNLLKSQINPHFLFNTLNNLFSAAQKNNDLETADGLLRLSHLMRYMIYESNAELVSLEKEIDYIRNYIDLKKLSLEKQEILQVRLPITDQFKSLFISPMILIPFIENAFKHGLNSQERNSIEIFLGIEEKILNLNVKNSFSHLKEHSNKETSGTGLENVKRRLLLVYPGRHSLAITSDNAFFYVDLKIEL